jgi:hypothetical protein
MMAFIFAISWGSGVGRGVAEGVDKGVGAGLCTSADFVGFAAATEENAGTALSEQYMMIPAIIAIIAGSTIIKAMFFVFINSPLN